jgi:hypothetical protein
MRCIDAVRSDHDDEGLEVEFWGRRDLWTRVKAPIATGIALAGAVGGVALLTRTFG